MQECSIRVSRAAKTEAPALAVADVAARLSYPKELPDELGPSGTGGVKPCWNLRM